MDPPSREDEGKRLIDPSKPFKGVVVCCTSIPHERRMELANMIVELGGIHRYDLTPDVTHLLVADYETPKYRHVAYERLDIKAMDAQWVEAVRDLWKRDDEIDFDHLEKLHQLKPLEKCGTESSPEADQSAARGSLLICLTKFGRQRDEIADMIVANGGKHTADFTKKCTHLIVHKPEGKKYSAAKAWRVHTVTLDWLMQSIERGMILKEELFDPELPPEEQGKNAWIKKSPRQASLGKRSRSEASIASEDGPRKLSRTASMKLRTQGKTIWGDILAKSTSKEPSSEPQSEDASVSMTKRPPSAPVQEDRGVFGDSVFCTHGFNSMRTRILEQTIASLGGTVAASIEDTMSRPAPREPLYRFLIVPQASQPDTHPQTTHEDLHIVTEFYIERCLHKKRFCHPNNHVLGRPFPQFPIAGFETLTICKAVFTGIELSQVGRSVAQLGGRFQDDLHRETSVMVCESLEGLREDKLKWALKWGVPVVSADWLWECISTGFKVPITDFIFPTLKQRYADKSHENEKKSKKTTDKSQTAARKVSTTSDKPPVGAGVDTADFDVPHERPRSKVLAQQDSITSADFYTPPSHRADSVSHDVEAPVGKDTFAAPEKPSLLKQVTAPGRILSEPFPKTSSAQVEPTERAPSAPPAIQAEAESREAEEKRKAEEARKQAKDAERQVLSSKITHLINSATGSAGAPEDESAKAVPRPRRRQILGRAISNVSNASSATSVEASKTALDAVRTTEIADSEDDDPSQPPATQLGYCDPEAQEHKAALLSRMMGENGEVKSVGTTGPSRMVSAPEIGGGRVLRRR